MGLIIGILAVLLVLFLVFTMAIAEWADKDIGEIFGGLFGKKRSAAKPAMASDAHPEPEKVEPAASQAVPQKNAAAKPARRPAAKSTGKPAAKTVPSKQSASKTVKKAAAKSTAAKTKTQSQKGKTK